jgi:Cu(I)/Ag(I) efflux system membrane fusion protein
MKKSLIILSLLVLVAAIAASAYWLGAHRIMPAPAKTASSAPSSEKKALYWYDPMYPQQKFERPGRSPFMDMDLVPKYSDANTSKSDPNSVSVSPGIQQNLGLRLATVERSSTTSELNTIGTVALDERAITLVQARTAGIVEKLFVRAPNQAVTAGQALATLLVPEWAAAQQEYLAIKRANLTSDDGLVRAARERLKLSFMPDTVIAQVERSGHAQPRLTLYAPQSGFVSELSAREGMQVTVGAPLFKLASLAKVWVLAEFPETQAALLQTGAHVTATAQAYPTTVFSGTVEEVLPEVDPATRTLKARIVVDNPGAKLKPGMYTRITLLSGKSQSMLVVPQEAVIVTGKRSVVIIETESNRFAPIDIKTGRELGDKIEVLAGLSEGQRVVASGQFLLDSEASLRSALPVAPSMKAATSVKAAPPAYATDGLIEKITPDAITISHNAIPALKWGPMTMDFQPPAGGLPKTIKAGDRVHFSLQPNQDAWQIVTIQPVAAGDKK